MNRLTNKIGIAYEVEDFSNCYEAIDKLGELEDIEEKYDIDLITLFDILEKEQCYDKENGACHIVGVARDGVILMPKAFPYGECEFTRPFTELNKTWFLTRKELEK